MGIKDRCCIVLAAGEGKRMKSDKPKVLSEVIFKPMLGWLMDTVLNECEIENICVVTGFKHEMVEKYLDSNRYKCEIVVQRERKGTAHAVKTAEKFLKDNLDRHVLILAGDAPFISKDIIEKAYNEHISQGNAVTIISSNLDDPYGYGRIMRDANNRVIGIVEEKDASESERKIKEVNSGAYWFSIDSLLKVLYNISNDTSQGEYYLTDAVRLLIEMGSKAGALESENEDAVLGANDSLQLSKMNSIARKRIIEKFIAGGVSIPCWDGVVIGKNVEIDRGCCILPGTVILGESKIKEGSVVGPNSQIYDCCVGRGAKINSSYCENSDISENQVVGPFSSIINGKDKFKVSL